jgi:hypothetical protein
MKPESSEPMHESHEMVDYTTRRSSGPQEGESLDFTPSEESFVVVNPETNSPKKRPLTYQKDPNEGQTREHWRLQ